MFELIQQWIDEVEIHNPRFARLFCTLIPAQCPFERQIAFFGYHFYIPPLCKLNPFYEQIVGLRFKCLSYLADECGIDVTQYC